jgi:hypothetical protein
MTDQHPCVYRELSGLSTRLFGDAHTTGPSSTFLIKLLYKGCIMDSHDPEKLRLVPGQGMKATFSRSPDREPEVGFFVRSISRFSQEDGKPAIQQRAGLIKFNDVFLVLTMLRVEAESVELFDVWWNYRSDSDSALFKRMAEQETLTVHFFDKQGTYHSVDTENGFRRFFSSLPDLFDQSEDWTEVEFDRAVRGFCAESYPKESLWDIVRLKSETEQVEETKPLGIEDYPGVIPEELKPFYDYLPEQGHCIRVVPSTFEDKAIDGNPKDLLLPAPVKTVLRCGIRWAKGYPVAPIPFIPGHGLAVPPDDAEF